MQEIYISNFLSETVSRKYWYSIRSLVVSRELLGTELQFKLVALI